MRIETRMDKPVVVADSNVLVKWYIPEKYSEEAIIMRNDFIYDRIKVIAPIYALLEYANTLRKYAIRGLIRKEDAYEALNLLVDTGVEYVDITPSYVYEALRYSIENNVTVYDAYYIVLAKKNNAYMYTADEKLLSKVKGKELRIRHVRDYVKDRTILLGNNSV